MTEQELTHCRVCGEALADHWRCALCSALGHLLGRGTRDRAICADCEGDLARRGLIRCRKCNIPKPKDDVCVKGKVRWCQKCEKQKRHDRYEANKEAVKQQARDYHHTHRDEQNARRKRYRDTHLEQERAAGRRWHWANRDKRLATLRADAQRRKVERRQYAADYRATHAEQVNATKRASRRRRKLKIIQALRASVLRPSNGDDP